jgi:death-on-curing protein
MVEPRWITAEQVVELNAAILEGSEELHFLRDRGALESAVARPRNRFLYESDRSVSGLTADLIFGVGKAHAFEQGNKRTAWAAGRFFARLNGFDISVGDAPAQFQLAQIIETSITSDVDGVRLRDALEARLRPVGTSR